MKKYLGDILLEKGYISSQDLSRALTYQMRKVLGDDLKHDWATGFLLDIARTKYNNRDEFYLGKILTELNLLPETRVREALEIQKAGTTDADKVAAVMKGQPFDTIQGQIEFDSKGDLKVADYVIWTVKDGKLQELAPSP